MPTVGRRYGSLSQTKAKILQRAGIGQRMVNLHHREVSNQALFFYAVYAADAARLQQCLDAPSFADIGPSDDGEALVQCLENRRAALQLFLAVAHYEERTQFTTSVQEDEQLLGAAKGRVAAAVTYRLRQKRLLQSIISALVALIGNEEEL
ncbi:hypothetical protein DIPPA_51932 [Diplonema papillatum]|nr:hypothetical protein DIPPA_51925 [Diplonema papillatum]KAJ9466029.1 hypothetical protein DIPPA_51929 [Diplonema papillatum]KAJ9466030.1 hypothetical protein DIPPA_51932 [Diplonema papillatum]